LATEILTFQPIKANFV